MGECILDVALRVVLVFRLQDYLLCLVCGFIAFGVSKVRPHCRSFSWTDGTIDLPYGGAGTFPSWTLPLIAVLPGVGYVVCEALRHFCWLPRRRAMSAQRDELREMHSGTSPFSPSPLPPPAGPSITVAVGDSAAPKQSGGQRATLGAVAEAEGMHGGRQAEVPAAARGDVRTAAAPPVASPLGDTAGGLTSRTAAAAASPSSSSPPSLQGQRRVNSGTSGGSNSGDVGGAATVRRRRDAQAGGQAVFTLHAPWMRFLAHAHVWVLTQAFAVTFAMLVVDTIKVYAGRLRPDFLARLRREGLSEASVDVDWCAAGKGGRVSFPSGHSAISFAAFVPFSFYVLHNLGVFRRSGVSLWCIVVGLLPQILPITVAVSRTRDNRHNFDDILAGSLIGIASALIALGANWATNHKSGQLVPRLPIREI